MEESSYDFCPICGANLLRTAYDCDEGRMLETTLECTHGHYSYEFAYGNVREYYDDIEVCSSYHDDMDEKSKWETLGVLRTLAKLEAQRRFLNPNPSELPQ